MRAAVTFPRMDGAGSNVAGSRNGRGRELLGEGANPKSVGRTVEGLELQVREAVALVQHERIALGDKDRAHEGPVLPVGVDHLFHPRRLLRGGSGGQQEERERVRIGFMAYPF